MSDRRLLLVHAHPDDEAIPTGVTIAHYAQQGAHVTLVTCTLGEEGEILAEDLAHLAADREGGLGEHRMTELKEAAEALGFSDVRLLGGAGRWRDSGMMGTPANDDPRAFWQADLDEATGALVAILREVRPQVVVTYDDNGDYGHPDHIQAHRVTMAAVDAAADADRYPDTGEAWQVAKVYQTLVPKSVLEAGFEYFKERDDGGFFSQVSSVDELPFGKSDELVTTMVDAPELLERKYAAMRAHRSQIDPDGFFFALPDDVAPTAFGREHFELVRGAKAPPYDESGWETDLFNGVN
jgi:N-acetyl-1-D-myo-inositol-2-amino-2-deoxy-alpha-D-glucopyranoside deacetylase